MFSVDTYTDRPFLFYGYWVVISIYRYWEMISIYRYWEAICKWEEALALTPDDETLHEMRAQV
jgi:hypothetical protein